MNSLLFTDTGGAVPLADLALAAAVYHKLDEHYPGHQWLVNADHEAGIVTVHLLYLDTGRKHGKWGYVIHVDKLNGDPTCRAAVKAGGEMLERYGLPRRGAGGDTKLRAIDNGLDVSR